MMKKMIFLLLVISPLLAIGQNDFNTRYFTINAKSLPEAPQLNNSQFFGEMPQLTKRLDEKPSSFNLVSSPTFAATMNAIKINPTNYWEPVDMLNAVNTTTTYIDKTLKVAPKDSNVFGFTIYTSDGSSKVQNTVYTEVRGLDLLSPCPPYGICPRCAHYKIGRGY